MKLKVFMLALLVLSCTSHKETAYGRGETIGNGKLITKEVKVTDYDGIEIGSGISCENVARKQSKKQYPVFNYKQTRGKAQLEITVDENIYPLLSIENSHGQLTISSKNRHEKLCPTKLVINGNSRDIRRIRTSGCIDFIADKSLSGDKIEIRVSGSSDIYLNDEVEYNELDIKVSGSGDVKANNIICRYLNAEISGSGDITMKGKSEYASYRVSGSGDVNAYNFIVNNAECRVSGSGDIKVYAREKLDARASGSGDIRYNGIASVNKSTSGGGSIRKSD